MAYVNLDIDLDEFEDQDLIDVLEHRGWFVGEYCGWEPGNQLTAVEIECILEKLQGAKPGTTEYFIYEKLIKR